MKIPTQYQLIILNFTTLTKKKQCKIRNWPPPVPVIRVFLLNPSLTLTWSLERKRSNIQCEIWNCPLYPWFQCTVPPRPRLSLQTPAFNRVKANQPETGEKELELASPSCSLSTRLLILTSWAPILLLWCHISMSNLDSPAISNLASWDVIFQISSTSRLCSDINVKFGFYWDIKSGLSSSSCNVTFQHLSLL